MSETLESFYGSGDFLNALKSTGIIPAESKPIPATINTPTPVLPDLATTGEPGSGPVKINLQGNTSTGPTPGIKEGGIAFGEILSNYLSQADKWAADPYQKGKAFAWGTAEMNDKFQRFYNHKNFQNLGFSPYRDNETFYNQNSSAWDDYGRTFTAWSNLFKTAFKSSLPFSGLYYDMDRMADDFNEANMLGMSTRGGAAGFTNNLILNSAYTFGLVGEMVLENVAIGAITGAMALSPGGQAGAVATGTAGVVRTASGLRKIYEGTKLASASLKYIQNLSKIDSARDFYSAAKAGTVSLAKFLNPLDETVKSIKAIRALENTQNVLKNKALIAKGIGSFYTDLRNINYAFMESSLEGHLTKKDLNEKLINDYYRENGKMAEGEAADKINQKSHEASTYSTLYNLPIILYSNQLVLGGLIRPFSTSAKLLGNIAGETSINTFKRLPNWKLGQEVYGKTAKTFKDTAKSIFTSEVLPWSPRYIKAQLGEGVQELSQEIIAVGAEDYFYNQYKDPQYAGFIASASKGINSQISKQGLEVFASGYLMGGLIQGPQKLISETIPKKIIQYTDPEKYKRYVEQKDKTVTEEINAANSLLSDIINFTENNLENSVKVKAATDAMEKAIVAGKHYDFQNHKDDLLFEHMFTLLKKGKTSLLTDHLRALQEMKDEELAEAFNGNTEDANEIRKNINSSINKIERLKKQYKSINERWQKPSELDVYDNDGVAMSPTTILSRQHDFAVKMLLFNREAFQRSLERKEGIMKALNSDSHLKEFTDFEFNVILEQDIRSTEKTTIKNQIESLKMVEKPDNKELYKLERKLKMITDFEQSLKLRDSIDPEDEEALLKNEKVLYNIYKEYLSRNANRKNKPLFNQDVKRSFIDIMDYFRLTKDELRFANQINILDSPDWFYRSINSRQFMMETAASKKLELINEGYEKFRRIEKTNDILLNGLWENDVFTLEDQLNAYVNDGTIPSEFYDANTKQLIPTSDPKFAKIKEVLDKLEPEPEIIPEEEKATEEVKPSTEEKKETIKETAPTVQVTPATPNTLLERAVKDLGFPPLTSRFSELPQELKDLILSTYKTEKGDKVKDFTDEEILDTEEFENEMGPRVAGFIKGEIKKELAKRIQEFSEQFESLNLGSLKSYALKNFEGTAKNFLQNIADHTIKLYYSIIDDPNIGPQLLALTGNTSSTKPITKPAVAPPVTPSKTETAVPVDRKTEIKTRIETLEDQIQTTYRFMSGTDSNAAVVRAEKDIKIYEEELKKLKDELATLIGKTETSSSDIEAEKADIERRRQEELSSTEGLVPYNEYRSQIARGAKTKEHIQKEINTKYDAELSALEYISEKKPITQELKEKIKTLDTAISKIKTQEEFDTAKKELDELIEIADTDTILNELTFLQEKLENVQKLLDNLAQIYEGNIVFLGQDSYKILKVNKVNITVQKVDLVETTYVEKGEPMKGVNKADFAKKITGVVQTTIDTSKIKETISEESSEINDLDITIPDGVTLSDKELGDELANIFNC